MSFNTSPAFLFKQRELIENDLLWHDFNNVKGYKKNVYRETKLIL